ncbi:MAG TPA: hypothetical protein VFS21_00430 [Roseiflexaceae bacterium]|nr:hypothetical protein [Roseiflexaceae bacterium]
MYVGQYTDGRRLLWNAAYRCERCGHQLELDGSEPTPQNIRQAIIAEHGAWELVIPEGCNRARALKVLRSALDLSIVEAAALRNRIPGPVMAGTEHEIRRLHHLLAAEHVPSEMVHRPEIEGEYAKE